MKKYIPRLLVAVIAFSIGTAAIYFFAWDKLNPYTVTHSYENNSPYSVLEGKTVHVKPYDATFDIPESWLAPRPLPERQKNLYLTLEELNYLYHHNGDDAEEAQVINSVLPFENCAAHIGDKGWGNYLWNDLQARVYVTNLTPVEIAARIETQGREKASGLFERTSVISGNRGEWEERTLDILDAPSYSDFILGENLDFYYRSFGHKTVVFVFLHTERFDKEINLILDSFKWRKAREGEV